MRLLIHGTARNDFGTFRCATKMIMNVLFLFSDTLIAKSIIIIQDHFNALIQLQLSIHQGIECIRAWNQLQNESVPVMIYCCTRVTLLRRIGVKISSPYYSICASSNHQKYQKREKVCFNTSPMALQGPRECNIYGRGQNTFRIIVAKRCETFHNCSIFWQQLTIIVNSYRAGS